MNFLVSYILMETRFDLLQNSYYNITQIRVISKKLATFFVWVFYDALV